METGEIHRLFCVCATDPACVRESSHRYVWNVDEQRSKYVSENNGSLFPKCETATLSFVAETVGKHRQKLVSVPRLATANFYRSAILAKAD